jgi:hypothetical protein
VYTVHEKLKMTVFVFYKSTGMQTSVRTDNTDQHMQDRHSETFEINHVIMGHCFQAAQDGRIDSDVSVKK